MKLSQLKDLNLNHNQLKVLPPEIGKLSQLTKIKLFDNQIETLPSEIGDLTNLTYLNAPRNLLRSLPSEIGLLTQLTVLGLGINQLQSVPPELGNLTQLEILYLNNNKLERIPIGIAKLTRLTVLALGNNPNLSIPKEIIEEDPQSILNYLTSLQEAEEIDKLYEAKMVLVGRGGGGKTTLVKKLTEPQYQFDPQENIPSTEGIEIKTWEVPIQQETTIPFQLNIWDFAGQEKYDATHQLFITERTLYIFVTEARKESNYLDFDYWLSLIKLLSNNSPVIVIQTKIDERRDEMPAQIYKSHFPNIVGFCQISCAEGYAHTLEAFQQMVKEGIQQLPQLGDKLPKAWVDIRKELESEKEERDYLTYPAYLRVCEKHGLNQEKADFLSSYFHNLGVIIHHKKDRSLKRIVIVNPDWATDALYNVLDSEAVQNKKGRFTDEDLDEIRGEEKYADRQVELLRLMKKYELCFEVKGQEGAIYIAPSMLPKDQLSYPPVGDQDVLRFQYEYEFMPAGIISRFIVKAHHMIEEDFYWKMGVVLTYEGNTRAEVIEDRLLRKITICIAGPEKKVLLAFIRKYLGDIHDDFEKLAFQEKIPCICDSCQGSKYPYLFDFHQLKKRMEKGKPIAECDKSFEDVSVKALVEGVKSFADFSTIRALVKKAQISEAIDLLLGQYRKDHQLLLIASRWSELQYATIEGGLVQKEASQERNRIISSILNFVESQERW